MTNGKVGIYGFEMPKNCEECPCMINASFAYDDPYGCVFTRKAYWRMEGRPPECPLIELDEDEDDLK